MTYRTSNDVFSVPASQDFSAAPTDGLQEPSVTPREMVYGESLRAYEERARELQEEASRLAMSSTPLFGETIREFMTKPGPETSPELFRMYEIGKELEQLRKNKVAEVVQELSPFKQYTQYKGLKGEALEKQILEDLIEEEAWIGGGVFTPQPQHEALKFFYENTNDQDEWFFTRTKDDQKTPYEVLRYIVGPSGIRKDYGDISMPVDGQEATNLLTAAETSLKRVDEKIYHPTSTGHHRA